MSNLDWNDSVKKYWFRQGLREEVKDILVGRDMPETFTEYVTLCIKLDNSWNARQQEKVNINKSRRSVLTPQIPKSYSPRPLASSLGPAPMELDGNRKRLSPQERQRRIQEGLCLYCGGVGHFARNCSNRVSSYKAQTLRAANIQEYPCTLSSSSGKEQDHE